MLTPNQQITRAPEADARLSDKTAAAGVVCSASTDFA